MSVVCRIGRPVEFEACLNEPKPGEQCPNNHYKAIRVTILVDEPRTNQFVRRTNRNRSHASDNDTFRRGASRASPSTELPVSAVPENACVLFNITNCFSDNCNGEEKNKLLFC